MKWCRIEVEGDGATEPALVPGDVVEVVNDAIGVLSSRVVRKA